jgi:hypothetical protein
MGNRRTRKRRTAGTDPFESLRRLLSTDAPLLADVLMEATLNEECLSNPAVDEALLKCALRIHQQYSGPQTLASAALHHLLGGLYEEEKRDHVAARHYHAALNAYARMPDGAEQLPLALKAYQRILTRLGRSAQGRSEAKHLRRLASEVKAKRRRS